VVTDSSNSWTGRQLLAFRSTITQFRTSAQTLTWSHWNEPTHFLHCQPAPSVWLTCSLSQAASRRGDWNARTGRQPTSAVGRTVHIPIKLNASFVLMSKSLHLHSAHPAEVVHTWRTSVRKCQRVYKEKRFLFRKEKQKLMNICQTRHEYLRNRRH
jgi:hypothetical protein